MATTSLHSSGCFFVVYGLGRVLQPPLPHQHGGKRVGNRGVIEESLAHGVGVMGVLPLRAQVERQQPRADRILVEAGVPIIPSVGGLPQDVGIVDRVGLNGVHEGLLRALAGGSVRGA